MQKRWWTYGCLGLVFALFSPVLAADVLTNDAVVAMVKGGLAEDVIIAKIRSSDATYDLSAAGILKLKGDGVSDAILKAMIERSAPPPTPPAKTAGAIANETDAAIALYRHGKGAEAVAAFDRLLMDRPNDDVLKVWKARALLEQARALKDANASGYKPLVVNAYRILQPMGRAEARNPDWNLAMAQAFWLNARPTWAGRAASTALDLRPNFAEAQIVLGDLSYDSERDAINAPASDPRRENARRFAGQSTRAAYQKALAMADAPPCVRAEALYKLGRVAADLEGKAESAREFWERAAAADPTSRYAVLAEQQLRRGRGR